MRQFGPRRSTSGSTGFFSSARRLRLPPGEALEAGGYHLDLRVKAPVDHDPFQGGPQGRDFVPLRGRDFVLPHGRDFVAVAQSGLGSFERFARGEGEQHLERALLLGRHLAACQHRERGPRFGGFLHEVAFTYGRPLRPPWVSGMAQGEAASLLVRLARATGDDALGEAAVDALAPLEQPVGAGGAAGELPGGGWFPEEYPTEPQSHVLNGGIFALWGARDVADALGDARARRLFATGLDSLASSLDRWSLGYLSRFDLFPFRLLPNVASSFYHVLHIDQLRALGSLTGDERVLAAARLFERQHARRAARALAFAHKAAFRMAVPRDMPRS
jgi:hypothetical protein